MNNVNSKVTPIINKARGMRKMSPEWYLAQEDYAAQSILRIVRDNPGISQEAAVSIFKMVSQY